MNKPPILILTSLVASLLMTGVIRYLADRFSLLDIPGERSSHLKPTPRGGGLAIVIAFLAALSYDLGTGLTPDKGFWCIMGATATLVAAIGLWDDIRPLPAGWRLAVHILAVAILIWWGAITGGLEWPLSIAPLLMIPFLVLVSVWFLNLFNFMDGIDGLAGAEGFFVAGAAAWLLYLNGRATEMLPPLLLAASCSGFLFWNWPPAKIFMGDVGSGFLGFVLAGMALKTSVFSAQLPLSCWLILPAVFVADATVTLLRRLLRGVKWYSAHRSHAYQQAAVRYRSHLKVTTAILAINFVWLLPLSYLCVILPRFGGIFAITAYLPLAALALKFGAGRESRP